MRARDVFTDRRPDCEVEIREIQFNGPYGPLRTGEVDLQISEFPVREPDLTQGPVLFEEPRALLVPSTHPPAGRESVCPADLASAPLITFTAEFPVYRLDLHLPARTPGGRPIARGPVVRYWPADQGIRVRAAGRG
ncbi:LysR family transcriptional regulator substrate-binding protein [Kitasatospora sp. NPDC085895]|uniref:LysR family transcriptional regulator substrate-binding protein n=1 Tax=Kitasatospora sp. NPDC085895 TaxID=3155057 RepID=UPI003450FA5E